MKIGNMNVTYEGVVVKVQRLYLTKDRESMQSHIRAFVDRAVTFANCSACGGARLNAAALASKIDGRNIAECVAMQISDLAVFLRCIDDQSVTPMLAGLCGTLDSLVEIGLGYLSLGQPLTTLSGGERQRLKLAIQMGEKATTYVLGVLLTLHDVGGVPAHVSRSSWLQAASSISRPDGVSRAGPGRDPSAAIKPAWLKRAPTDWSQQHTPSMVSSMPMSLEIWHRPAATARRTARSRWLRVVWGFVVMASSS